MVALVLSIRAPLCADRRLGCLVMACHRVQGAAKVPDADLTASEKLSTPSSLPRAAVTWRRF
jgi:hypothetical protein